MPIKTVSPLPVVHTIHDVPSVFQDVHSSNIFPPECVPVLAVEVPSSTPLTIQLYDRSTPLPAERGSYTAPVTINYERTRNLKNDFVLEHNTFALIQKYGIDCIGFITLTFADKVFNPKEASRRFNSLTTHAFRKLFLGGIFVKELHADGSLHIHGLVACAGDIRTGFNWDQVRGKNYSSANHTIKKVWKSLRGDKRSKNAKLRRGICESYGFGRHNLEPVKNSAAVTKYIAKYLTKGFSSIQFDARFKGIRMVSYLNAKAWRTVSCRFQWVGGKSKDWRRGMARLAKSCGVAVDDFETITRLINSYMDNFWSGHRAAEKWAYWFTHSFNCDFRAVAIHFNT